MSILPFVVICMGFGVDRTILMVGRTKKPAAIWCLHVSLSFVWVHHRLTQPRASVYLWKRKWRRTSNENEKWMSHRPLLSLSNCIFWFSCVSLFIQILVRRGKTNNNNCSDHNKISKQETPERIVESTLHRALRSHSFYDDIYHYPLLYHTLLLCIISLWHGSVYYVWFYDGFAACIVVDRRNEKN